MTSWAPVLEFGTHLVTRADEVIASYGGKHKCTLYKLAYALASDSIVVGKAVEAGTGPGSDFPGFKAWILRMLLFYGIPVPPGKCYTRDDSSEEDGKAVRCTRVLRPFNVEAILQLLKDQQPIREKILNDLTWTSMSSALAELKEAQFPGIEHLRTKDLNLFWSCI